MIKKLSGLILFFFSFFPFLIAQRASVAKAVAFIETKFVKGSETGSAIIIGEEEVRREEKILYLVTAKHVVVKDDTSAESIKITLKNQTYEGTFVAEYSGDLDLALIKVKVPVKVPSFTFRPIKEKKLKNGLLVETIGYPYGAYTHKKKQVYRKRDAVNSRLLIFDSNGATPKGYSGGILTAKKNKRIVGMIVQDYLKENTRAIDFKEIKHWLINEQDISIKKYIKSENAIKPWALGLTITSVIAIPLGIHFSNRKEELYTTYTTVKDATAPVYSETSREETFKKAKTNKTGTCISYIVSGIAGVLAIYVEHQDWIKRQFTKERGEAYWELKSTTPHQIGVVYNF